MSAPDGYFHRIDPYAPPLANEELLTRVCVNADHAIPASFINIDTDTYSTAEFAFASDPWPRRSAQRHHAPWA